MPQATNAASERLDHLSEAQLTESARQGDRSAFAAIMRRHNQALFRVARAIVTDEAEAEDVVQESYLRAFRALGTFRGESGLRTWLTRIAINEARGRLRRRRRTVGLDQIEVAQGDGAQIIVFPGAPVQDSPETAMALAQIRALLERAVDSLPEAFRLVFILREVEGCSVEETAMQLGVPPATVKTRLHRARRQLREALDDTLASALRGTFPFLGARCDRITTAVIERLG